MSTSIHVSILISTSFLVFYIKIKSSANRNTIVFTAFNCICSVISREMFRDIHIDVSNINFTICAQSFF